jgi:thiamine biosynthesis lipoprotein
MKQIAGQAMGGSWVLMTQSTLPDALLASVVQRELDAVNTCMSPWLDDSEMNRISAAPVGTSFEVSSPLADVINFALELETQTDGALNLSLGGEVSQTGFGPAERSCRNGRLVLVGRTLIKHGPMQLDLCAVAKGYAIDRATAALITAGTDNFLLNVSGDIKVNGTKQDGTPWQIALELPIPDQQVVYKTVEIAGAIATSGTYRCQRDSGKINHLIDGRSRQIVSHGLISVTVHSDTAMHADGWATALAVLGPIYGPRKAKQLKLSAVFMCETDGGFNEQTVGIWVEKPMLHLKNKPTAP